MDLVVIAVAVLMFTVITLIVLLRTSRGSGDNGAAEARAEGNDAVRPGRRNRVAPAQPGGDVRRRRNARQRLAAGTRQDDSDVDADDDAIVIDRYDDTGKKLGSKKMAKLQEKEEKRRMREAEALEREERKKRDELRAEQKRKEEQEAEALEAAQEEAERKRKEEEEQREYEEYLKMKEAFVVEEEGEDAILEQDMQGILQAFVDYIKEMKVVMLEDLASHFKLRTQDVIDRIKDLQAEGRLSGVMDDRGKFIYITEDEYQAVAKFIRQRGRVSLTELAESSNQLINMTPENQDIYEKKLLSEETGTVVATS